MFKRLARNRTMLARLDLLIIALPLGVLLGWALVGTLALRNALVVWSCGGNYEFLKEYIRDFEQREGCRVRYTAAPVQFLLELAAQSRRPPDVMVGRAGPGWVALEREKMLAQGPVFFGIDPLVIAVAQGNPRRIVSLEDLGRPGVRIVQAPAAMRPKSKVPALLMAAVSRDFSPGLVEQWENNVTIEAKCGRRILAPIVGNAADAAIVPQSMLSYPKVRGRLDMIPIPAPMLLALRQGRASLAQCAGVLRTSRDEAHRTLATRFVEGLAESHERLQTHGYLRLTDDQALDLAELLTIGSPKDVPGLQVDLAERLAECGALREARRRFLKVLYAFGPNRYTARALYHTALLSRRLGNLESARGDLRTVLKEYPPAGRKEYDSDFIVPAPPVPVAKKHPYEHWIRASKSALAEMRTPHAAPPAKTSAPLRIGHWKGRFPLTVTEGDPPGNGKREFALALHLLMGGDAEFATRSFLKVVTLNYPSRFMSDAEYWLGVCAEQRGLKALACAQWERTRREYPRTPAAEAATVALANVEASASNLAGDRPGMPLREESFETHAERAMTYGMRLYAHGLPLFAFKEMIKLCCGVYGEGHDMEAEARYRAGIAALAFGHRQAAAWQWHLCRQHSAGSKWASEAERRIRELGLDTAALDGQLLPPKQPVKGPTAVRFAIAEEFRRAGVYEGQQMLLEYLKVLTVAQPKPGTQVPLVEAAAFRVAECLEQTGHSGLAIEQYRYILEKYPQSAWAEKAQTAWQRLTTVLEPPHDATQPQENAPPEP